MEFSDFQKIINKTYYGRDSQRGVDTTFRWLVEEIGELAKAIKKQDQSQLIHEVGDVLAWVISLANLLEIDVENAVKRFINGCPKCNHSPCQC